MNIVTVKIDISRPAGRRLFSEVSKHPGVATVEKPLPDIISDEKTYNLNESYDRCCEILSKNYGVDVRKL